MNKVLFSSLPLILVLLTGCEHLPANNSNTVPSSDGAPALAVQDIKKLASSWGANTDVISDDNFFSSAEKKTSTPDVALSKPMDFDNFFSDTKQTSTFSFFDNFSLGAAQTKPPATAPTSTSTPLVKSKASWNDNSVKLGDDFFSDAGSRYIPDTDVPLEDAVDFDNFFSTQNQSTTPTLSVFASTSTQSSLGDDTPLEGSLGEPMDFSSFFSNASTSEFQFDAKKQEKINAIKERTSTSRNNNIVGDQFRNKDVDTQLAIDLANIREKEENIDKDLAQTMKKELADKVRLLNAETALKIAEIKMSAHTKSDAIVSRIEDRVLSAKSSVSKGLIKEMLVSAPGEYYRLKIQSKKLQAKHQVDIAKAKLQYQQKLDVLNNDVKFLRDANKSIINIRMAELEEQRIAEALVVEQKIKAKNQAIVDQLYPEFKTELAEYINTTNQRLEKIEKQILDKLESNRLSEELAREAQRKSEKRQYMSDINKQIKKDQVDYESRSRDKLFSLRDAKIESIVNNSKRSIKRVESGGVQALADLKAQNMREIEKQKGVLQAPYKKKKQILTQKSQQARSKVLSRFNAENYAILAKEKKEVNIINREIDARVRTEIKVALDSFKVTKKGKAALKKDKAAFKTTDTTDAPEPEPSSGFFSSWF